MSADSYAGDVTPQEAWKILSEDPDAVLIDCRTQPEWGFVGVPDLSGLGKEVLFVPWQIYPAMQGNPAFADQIASAGVGKDAKLLFLCRSGMRSKAAAIAMTEIGYAAAYNVSEGFEGGLDQRRHRGVAEGWKAAGLPWVQQ
ncbi:MAG: rhodanese-like domain-containing protein [Alphaproteobacteria bacterium]|nr:rhodanese-like domain-containing protein [Alphaproteobacteria bacterium]